jgi:ABC-type branched-subunit amino acid transport system substrate-binding protein
MKKEGVCFMGIIALFSLLLLVAPAVSSGERGVTDSGIKVGAWHDLSGNLTYYSTSIMNGAGFYFKQVNESGGVNGRKIEYVVYDDGFEPQRSLAAAKRLVAQDGVFAFVAPMGTPTTAAVIPYAVENKVPIFGPGLSSHDFTRPVNPYVYLTAITYYDQMSIGIDFLVKNRGKKKVALFSAGGEIGASCEAGASNRLKKYGLKIVTHQEAPRDAVDVSAQANKIRLDGADAVIIATQPKPADLLILECKKMGYKPDILLYSVLAEPAALQLKDEDLEGVFGIQPFPAYTGREPGVVEYNNLLQKYGNNLKSNMFSFWGFITGKTFVEIVRRMGKDVTVDRFIKTAESLKNFDTGTGINISFGPDNHEGARMAYVVVAKQGKFIKISDWLRAE